MSQHIFAGCSVEDEGKHEVKNMYDTLKRKIDKTRNKLNNYISRFNTLSHILYFGEEAYEDDADRISLKEIVPGTMINMPVMTVNKINEIPNNIIYFVRDLNQFAFKLNGEVFRGNVGNILTNTNSRKITACRFGMNCQKGTLCSFYHDPYKIPGSHDIRNFPTQSFIYKPIRSRKKQSDLYRHIGSRDTLLRDVGNIEMYEFERLGSQIVHDLLVYMAIRQHFNTKLDIEIN